MTLRQSALFVSTARRRATEISFQIPIRVASHNPQDMISAYCRLTGSSPCKINFCVFVFWYKLQRHCGEPDYYSKPQRAGHSY